MSENDEIQSKSTKETTSLDKKIGKSTGANNKTADSAARADAVANEQANIRGAADTISAQNQMAQNTKESIGANTFLTDDYYERRDAFVKKMKRRAKSKKIFVFGILILLLLLLLSGGTYYVVHSLSVQKPHTHTFSEVWTTDDSAHWHKCSGCQDIKDKANHTYDDDCDADCNVCGALRTAPHSYDAAYRDDATNHWQECTVCHTPTAAVAHSYSSDCDATCNVCDATRTVSAEHTFGTEWIGIVDGHYHLCTKCGAESSHL